MAFCANCGAEMENGINPFISFFVDYVNYLERFGITEAGGMHITWSIDLDSVRTSKDNTELSANVKRLMKTWNCNLSTTNYDDSNGATIFIFNFLNSKGKYEFCSFEAYKKDWRL
ncbi:MAG: hypothetical protein Ta2G_18810 [Termitinemataceae bacterium]|nr:MAG: hypothetical protein Ta2G_18810 [Termitinemataceae bacterium]